MQRFFGSDHIAFTTCSTTLPAGNCSDPNPETHSFTSFSQAADENALSRILVGYHFRNAMNQGLRHGTRIGHHTFVHFLRRLKY
jgi:hypothetical protein